MKRSVCLLLLVCVLCLVPACGTSCDLGNGALCFEDGLCLGMPVQDIPADRFTLSGKPSILTVQGVALDCAFSESGEGLLEQASYVSREAVKQEDAQKLLAEMEKRYGISAQEVQREASLEETPYVTHYMDTEGYFVHFKMGRDADGTIEILFRTHHGA